MPEYGGSKWVRSNAPVVNLKIAKPNAIVLNVVNDSMYREVWTMGYVFLIGSYRTGGNSIETSWFWTYTRLFCSSLIIGCPLILIIMWFFQFYWYGVSLSLFTLIRGGKILRHNQSAASDWPLRSRRPSLPTASEAAPVLGSRAWASSIRQKIFVCAHAINHLATANWAGILERIEHH